MSKQEDENRRALEEMHPEFVVRAEREAVWAWKNEILQATILCVAENIVVAEWVRCMGGPRGEV